MLCVLLQLLLLLSWLLLVVALARAVFFEVCQKLFHPAPRHGGSDSEARSSALKVNLLSLNADRSPQPALSQNGYGWWWWWW